VKTAIVGVADPEPAVAHPRFATALQRARRVSSTRRPSTRGGLRRTIDTLRWRIQSFEEELDSILAERESTLGRLKAKEAELLAMSSSEDEESDGDEE
jgi:hypothetical protein